MSRGNSYLDKVRTVSIQGSNLQKFTAKLANHLSGMTNLSVLNLSGCSLTASNMKHIASSLGNKTNLTDLDLRTQCCLGWLCNIMVSSFEANETPSEAALA